ITENTATKIAVQMSNIIQCRKCCSCAILVAGGAKFNWRAAGAPRRALAGRGAKATPSPGHNGEVLEGMGCKAHPCTGHQRQAGQLARNALHGSHLFSSLDETDPLRIPLVLC